MAAADNWLVQSQLEEKGLWLNQATQNTEAGQLSEKIWFDRKNETDSVTKTGNFPDDKALPKASPELGSNPVCIFST